MSDEPRLAFVAHNEPRVVRKVEAFPRFLGKLGASVVWCARSRDAHLLAKRSS
jgi:hypothetical protein